MTLNRIAVALMLAAGFSTCALAQNVKMLPGLWEVQSNLNTGGEMEKMMAELRAQLGPEQRRQMEQAMAQQGVGVSSEGQSATIRQCLTQKDVDLDHVQMDKGCTSQTKRLKSNTLHLSFQCKGNAEDPPSSGEGTITLNGPKSYLGQYTMQTTMNGKPAQITMKQQGKWLKADCGDVKPFRQ